MKRKIFLSLFSGFLLTLAFPRANLWGLAWVALVPLFYSLQNSREFREAFFLAFAAGFVFYLLSLSWLRHVTVFGLFFISTMLAAYWGIFGIIFYRLVKDGGPPSLLFLSAAWTALEFIRSEIPVWGFGWNLLGYSQASNIFIAQLASIGGAYAVSFLVFLGNGVAYSLFREGVRRRFQSHFHSGGCPSANALGQQGGSETGSFAASSPGLARGFRSSTRPWFQATGRWRRRGAEPSLDIPRGRVTGSTGNLSPVFGLPAGGQGIAPEKGQPLLVFSLLLAAVFFHGWSRLETYRVRSPLRISVLQGNIPQLLKWDAAYRNEILRIYLNLTELASYDDSELIVWPEAAYPGFFNREAEADKVRALVQKIKIPTLVGSPHQEVSIFFNSAYLLDPAGETVQRYDKLRLVPFGEYVPWKPVFGFLERYAYSLGVSDFSPGREALVFKLGHSGHRFSTLICFEDIFPDLARKFVLHGAGFLVVMTNDTWFGRSSAPYQHLQASVFRAIENGVSIVRAANTGVSGFINSRGVVAERVHNQDGKDTFMTGGVTYPVETSAEETLYQKGGWLFPWVCLGVLVLSSLALLGKGEGIPGDIEVPDAN